MKVELNVTRYHDLCWWFDT